MKRNETTNFAGSAIGPRAGVVVGGRYRLIAPLAEGGMGSVWRAEHESLRNAVAVKFLSAGSVANPSSRARFEREARLAAQVGADSKHVVKVLDHGVADDGTPWISMELLHGEGLDTLLRRDGNLRLERVASIVRQIARGLEVAHRHGVIHRDLKPANVFLCHDLDVDGEEHDDAKILDFGVAKSLWDDDEAPTREGVVLGTPGYMSPEQLAGDAPVDTRADVWALGAIAYRMLAGRPPFGIGTTAEIGARVQSSEPPAPSHALPWLPEEIDTVLARALAKDRAKRYPTARALAEAFTSASGLAAVSVDLSSPSLPGTPAEGAIVVSASAPISPFRTARARVSRVIGATTALLMGVGGFLLCVGAGPQPERRIALSAPAPAIADTVGTHDESEMQQTPNAEAVEAITAVASASASSAVSAAASAPPPRFRYVRRVVDTWDKRDEM